MTGHTHRRFGIRRTVLVVLGVVAATATGATQARAQVLPAVIGGVGGLVTGAHMTTGLYVLKTRATGWVMHSVEHLLEPTPEAIPLVVAPVAGAVMGYRSSSTLASAGLWGGVGLASGAAVGAGVGHLLWGDAEGRWAGGVMGSAAGLLLGIVLGAAKGGRDDEAAEGEAPLSVGFSFRSPFGGSR